MSTSPITKPSEALRAARELLSDPKRWTQGYYAYDLQGDQAWPWDRRAVCWCGAGALEKVAGFGGFSEVGNASLPFLQEAVSEWYPPWQDRAGRKHAEVLAAFDRAIALAESFGQ